MLGGKLPNIGMRNIKTALTAALVAALYYLVGRSPAFACIGVIFGMGADLDDGYFNGGGNRLWAARRKEPCCTKTENSSIR